MKARGSASDPFLSFCVFPRSWLCGLLDRRRQRRQHLLWHARSQGCRVGGCRRSRCLPLAYLPLATKETAVWAGGAGQQKQAAHVRIPHSPSDAGGHAPRRACQQ